jgi:hypothetical protein
VGISRLSKGQNRDTYLKAILSKTAEKLKEKGKNTTMAASEEG